MGITEDRIKHCLGVAKKMKQLSKEIKPEDTKFQEDMFMLGILHDIGYEFADIPSEHSEVGSIILKSNNYKYWKEVLYHGKRCSKIFKSLELEILNTADLTTDRQGNPVKVSDRLDDVKQRYGEESPEYIEFNKLAKELKLV